MNRAPTGTDPGLAGRIECARQARRRVLDGRSTDDIAQALSEAAAMWRPRDTKLRRDLIPRLSRSLDLAEAMLETAIDNIFSPLDPAGIQSLLAGQTTGAKGLLGPELVFHRLAGNVPGQAIPALACSLLTRSVCLLRESERQPLLTEAFVATLASRDADLAQMVVTASWPAEDEASDALVAGIAGADGRIELYGSDRTLAGLAADGGAFGGCVATLHGSRQSLAYVATGHTPAGELAEDIAMYEGQGCLSPHHIIVEGDAEAARGLAGLLGAALDDLEQRWPRRRRDLATETRRRAFIAEREVLSANGKAPDDMAGPDQAWYIAVDTGRTDRLRPGPGSRVVTVVAGGETAAALELCRHTAEPLAGAALAAGGPRRERLASELTAAGATLVCRPGLLQAPPLDWRQDGHGHLAKLLLSQKGRAA